MKELVIGLLILISLPGFSQKESFDELPKNVLSGGIGRSRDISETPKITALGFDYLRKLSYRWEIGIQLDVDLEKSTLDYEGIVGAAIGAYSITQKWPVFGGFGVAFEGQHREGLFRLGTEYVFFLSKRQFFFVAPGFFTDFYKESQTYSFMFVFGVNW